MNLLVKVKKYHDSKECVYDYPTMNEIEQLISENYQVIIINADIINADKEQSDLFDDEQT